MYKIVQYNIIHYSGVEYKTRQTRKIKTGSKLKTQNTLRKQETPSNNVQLFEKWTRYYKHCQVTIRREVKILYLRISAIVALSLQFSLEKSSNFLG